MRIIQFLAETAELNTDIPKLDAMDVLLNVLNSVYFIAGIIAVVVIILAGYTFSTSVYDPAKITQAKNALIYSVVGVIVIIMAWGITQFIMGKF